MSTGHIIAVILVGCVVASLLVVTSIEVGTGFFSSISTFDSMLNTAGWRNRSSTPNSGNNDLTGSGATASSGHSGSGGVATTTSNEVDPAVLESPNTGRYSANIFEQFPTDSITSSLCEDESSCGTFNRRELIHSLRAECSPFRDAIKSSRVKSPVSSLDGLVVNDISSELVCFHRGEIYSDEEESRRKVFVRRGAPVITLDLKDLTASLPLSKATKVSISRSVALTMLDVQAGYHLFHLLADNVLPLAWHLFGNPSDNVTFMSKLRRSVVFTTTSSQRHQIGKCMACVELGEVFAPRVHYAHVDDDNIQCFCGGYFNGVVYLPYHEEMYTNMERSRALRWLQTVLAAHFDLPAYTGKSLASTNFSVATELSISATAKAPPSPSLAAVASSTSDSTSLLPPIRTHFRMNGQPRLLLVQRKRRSIGPILEIYQRAVTIGFDVAFTFFEGLPMRKQFRLARFADVFVSIHGMALTWAFAMDGSTPASRGCRTMIELRHYVRPFPLKLQFYKHIASSANLSYIEVPATTCKFGKSVRHPEKEYNRMFLASFVIGLKGFHDQVAAYNLTLVGVEMVAAFQRAKKCPS